MVTGPELLAGLLFTASGVGGLALAYLGYSRTHQASIPFALTSFGAGVWGILYGPIMLTHNLPVLGVLYAVMAVAQVLLIASYFWFIVVYVGREDWLTLRRKTGFWAVAGLLAVVTSLGRLDSFVGADVAFVQMNGFSLPVLDFQLSNLFFLIWAFSTAIIGLVILFRFLIAERNMYRKQTAIILGAFLFPAVGATSFPLGLTPHPSLDPTLLFYDAEVALIAVALFRYEFLDVEPLAPDVVLNEVEDPVLILDDDDRLVDYNPAATALVGDVSRGTPTDEVLPGIVEAAMAGDEYSGAEDDDGTPAEVYDLNRAPIRDRYGRERGCVIVLRDITVQKQRERTLDNLQSANQQFLGADSKQEVMDTVIDTAVDALSYPYSGIMAHDEDTNQPEPGALADPLRDAFQASDRGLPVVPESADSDVWEVFESGTPQLGQPMTPSTETDIPVDIGGSLLLPLGDHGVLGISAGPDHEQFSSDDRRFARILSSATEAALDRLEKEQQLRESRELLERRSEQVEFFNGVLRHDLLNAMTVISAHLETLETHVGDDGTEHLDVVSNWTEDITDLTKRVRAVNKAISGEDEPALEPVDIASAVETKAHKLSQGYENTTVHVDVTSVQVSADEFLPAVVENVLRNAVDHNDTDNPVIRVEIVAEGGSVELRVIDNGPGVPDEMKDKIFQESVTSDDSGTVGFGLHFVRVMMERYDGDVWFEDRADGQRGAVAVLQFNHAEQDWRESVDSHVEHGSPADSSSD